MWNEHVFFKLERLSHLDADPNECALWMLLKRTFSADRAVRQQAVQELAQNHHWQGERQQHFNPIITRFIAINFLAEKKKTISTSLAHQRKKNITIYSVSSDWSFVLSDTDYQYRTAAQVVDQRTSVALARIPNVDLRFFLPPPLLPHSDDVGSYHSDKSQIELLFDVSYQC